MNQEMSFFALYTSIIISLKKFISLVISDTLSLSSLFLWFRTSNSASRPWASCRFRSQYRVAAFLFWSRFLCFFSSRDVIFRLRPLRDRGEEATCGKRGETSGEGVVRIESGELQLRRHVSCTALFSDAINALTSSAVKWAKLGALIGWWTSVWIGSVTKVTSSCSIASFFT